MLTQVLYMYIQLQCMRMMYSTFSVEWHYVNMHVSLQPVPLTSLCSNL